MKIVFFGTPQFAVPTLDALAREHEIALVVAQPDKPAGRGLKIQPPAVAVRARERNLTVVQPPKVKGVLQAIEEVKPDVGIIVAYGKILPPAILDVPKYGFLNVHGSILPKYRGAAPIQRAIEDGETETGVTIMRVDEQLDHGPILSIARTPIHPDEHMLQLGERLAEIGAAEMLKTLRLMPTPVPQDHAAATYAPKIEKEEGAISWTDDAQTLYNKFRAFDPWPGIYAGDLKLVDVRPVPGKGEPGTILRIGEGVVIAAGTGALEVLKVKKAGRDRIAAVEYARGAGWRVGAPIA